VRSRLSERPNLAEVRTETWRPPLHDTPDTRSHRWRAAARRILDLQAASIWRDLACELPHARGLVVDVGCGAQPYRPLLGQEARYLGIDTVDAKANFGYEIPDTVYFEGETWPVEDESADVIVCAETLEHVLRPEGLLVEAHRCLRPGGLLLLTVPFSARWHFIPNDYWRFTPSSLDQLLSDAGFNEIAVYARGNAGTVACYKLMALVLPFLVPAKGGLRARFLQLLALLAAPLVLALALVGKATLKGKGGDDCLGYTVTALRD
jgi:SAM-dependent methyltransferase